jgi:amino acid adenylation domain-containing protein
MRAPSQVVHERLESVLYEGEGSGVTAPADLSAPPLVRARLRNQSGGHELEITAPALSADRRSLLALVQEVAALYDGTSLDNEPLQYADYAEWRAELLRSGNDEMRAGADFWRDRRRVSVPLLLHGRRAPQPGAYETLAIDLTSAREGLQRAAGTLRTDVGTLLEACLHLVAARIAGDPEVLAETTLDSRVHQELAGALGPLTQTALLSTRVTAATTVAEVVDQVQRARADLIRWIDYQPAVVDQRDTFGLGFEYLEHAAPVFDGAPAHVAELTARVTPVALQLIVRDDGNALRGELSYDAAVYDADDVQTFAECYSAVAADLVRAPNTTAGAVRLLDEPARARVISASQGPEAEVPATTVHALFAEQVRRVGHRVAVTDGSASLTYDELDVAAGRLARRLRELGVGPDVAVGLCFDRSPEMIAALLGILKAGGAYLPLNFEHPVTRLRQQLASAGATVVVTARRLADALDSVAAQIVCIDDDSQAEPDDGEPADVRPDHAVYVMYTSGSTGVPKGVTVTHRNLVHYTRALIARLEAGSVSEGLSFGAVSAISTDLGNTAVFPSLLSGGTLNLIPPDASLDGARYAAYAAEHPIDVLKITPSHLKGLLATAAVSDVAPRRWLVLGGESSSWNLVDGILAQGKCRVLNHYGPTETTVGACTFEVTRDVESRLSRAVPIGRPLPNVGAFVVDEGLDVVPVGVPGELWIGGVGVARGYAGDEEETSKRFVHDRFSSGEGRLYRTGDRVRYLRGGALEFLGRIDDQIKIRGYRVEPGEVEAVVSRYDGVRQAAVLPLGDAESGWRLVAYVVAAPQPTVADLREYLLTTLPEFMVPAEYAFIDSLPLTANGKVNRQALASLATTGGGERDYVAPRDPVEERIAAMWSEVLGVESVGIHDDFFDLGGHSLLATQVIARVRAAYNAHVPLHALFAAPTVADLAAAVKQDRPAATDDDADELLADLATLPVDELTALLAADGEAEGA